MSAYNATHLTLDGVGLRTRAIDCFDWSDLFQRPYRGVNRVAPGQVGSKVRPRVADEVAAALPVRLNGGYDDNTWLGGDDQTQHSRLIGHLDVLHGIGPGVVDLEFVWADGSTTVDCLVDAFGTPRFDTPGLAVVVIEVTLPDGPMSLASS